MIAPRLRVTPEPVPRRGWGAEQWLVVAMLLTVALLHSFVKFTFGDETDDSTLGEVVWGGMYAFAGFRLLSLSGPARPLARHSLSLLAFLGLTVISSLWSSDPYDSFKHAGELLGTTLVAWYIVSRFSLSEFLHILAVAFTTISVLSVLLIFGSPARGRMDWGTGAYNGVFGEKNGLGAAMAVAILTFMLLIPRARGRDRVVLISVLVLAACLLAGSDSITAFLACTGTLAILLAVWSARQKKYSAIAAVVLVGGLAAVVVCGFLGIDSGTFFDALGRNPNLTGRTEMWPGLVAAVLDKPFLGFGYDSFFNGGQVQVYLADFIAKYNWTPPHAHNSFLQIALDTGLIGLGMFLVVLVTAIRRDVSLLWRRGRAIDFWPLGLVLFLILGSYDETYFALANSLEWIFFTAALLYPLRELDEPATLARREFASARRS